MRQISARTAAALSLAICALGTPPATTRPAAAYIRTTTQDGHPLRWLRACVQIAPGGAITPDTTLHNRMTAAQVTTVLGRATSNWDAPSATCSALSLHAGAPQACAAQNDGVNVIMFVSGFWGRDQISYDPSAAAVTSVSYVNHPGDPTHGSITDADTELNAVGFTFAQIDPADPDATPDPDDGTRLADLESTLTHELGHVLGLGHTCWDHIQATPPLDQDGRAIPDCRGPLPATIVTTTMFPYFADGETSKRNLSPDEVHALCGSYPEGSALQACDDSLITGCQLGGDIGHRRTWAQEGRGVGGLLLAISGLAGLARRRRPRRGAPRRAPPGREWDQPRRWWR